MDPRIWIAMVGALLATTAAHSADKTPLPGTGPWDVKSLQKTVPKFELSDTQEVKEGDVAVKLSTVYYDGEPLFGKPTRVWGYYARPAQPTEKKMPAMVLVHGGGGTAFPQWARLWAARGYAALAMDLAGCGPERKRLPDGAPDQNDDVKFRRLKDGVTNMWSYHAVADVIRGASLLASLPEVDKNRLGITGISWGGYLTSIVMSLDDRLKVAVPVYGCGYLHENSVWVPILNSLPADEKETWVKNFDPSSYLPRCKIPVLWMNGTNDFAYPLDSYQKCYRATRGPRTLCITVKMPHGHEAGWARPEIQAFIDSFLKRGLGDVGLAKVGPPGIDGKKVHVVFDGGAAMQKAEIHWTTDLSKPWQQREWKTSLGDVVGLHEVTAELPTERPAVFFLTLTDARGSVVSTEHSELK